MSHILCILLPYPFRLRWLVFLLLVNPRFFLPKRANLRFKHRPSCSSYHGMIASPPNQEGLFSRTINAALQPATASGTGQAPLISPKERRTATSTPRSISPPCAPAAARQQHPSEPPKPQPPGHGACSKGTASVSWSS